MTITREEFKQLVHLFIEVNNTVDVAVDFINEDKAGELAYPVFDWIERQLQIDEEHIGDSMLWMLASPYGPGVAINWKYDEDGEEWNSEYTRDLDKIYDYYFEEGKGRF